VADECPLGEHFRARGTEALKRFVGDVESVWLGGEITLRPAVPAPSRPVSGGGGPGKLPRENALPADQRGQARENSTLFPPSHPGGCRPRAVMSCVVDRLHLQRAVMHVKDMHPCCEFQFRSCVAQDMLGYCTATAGSLGCRQSELSVINLFRLALSVQSREGK
jgi:hypothetical protein